jgi:hypothetical protein
MEQSPSWEANCLSVSQEMYYCLHKIPLLVPVLSQTHPFHILPHYFLKIHYNIIFLFIPRSSKWSLPFTFPDQNFLCIYHLFHAYYMPCTPHTSWLYHPNNVWWCTQVMKLLIMQSFPAFCHFVPPTSIFTSASCSQTLLIYVLPLVWQTKFHTHTKR